MAKVALVLGRGQIGRDPIGFEAAISGQIEIAYGIYAVLGLIMLGYGAARHFTPHAIAAPSPAGGPDPGPARPRTAA